MYTILKYVSYSTFRNITHCIVKKVLKPFYEDFMHCRELLDDACKSTKLYKAVSCCLLLTKLLL